MARPKIKTSHEYPPIPIREFDWLAYRDGDEEPGGLQGWGRTEAEAICDLLDREEEADDAREQVAQFMIRHSFATGHGDTVADLLGELDWQLKARLRAQEEDAS